MADQDREFQPGHMLHTVIVGALRAQGSTFQDWCQSRGVHQSRARSATYGQSSGPAGRALLDEIIDAAGRETVTTLYIARIRAEAARVAS